jgi:hydroxymethylpyrimidine/phosphomethylpyrimidine kinase
MRRAADAILALGAGAVLVKGGHLEDPGRSDDLFVGSSWEGWLEGERIDTPNTHGTGCTLSAAIAARLALGDDVPDAVRAAKAFVSEAIRHALTLGGGIGPVDPIWAIRSGRPDLTSRD